jgi:hypothetical protein
MSDANIVEYKIQLTLLALEMLATVKDRREQEKLSERVNSFKDGHYAAQTSYRSVVGFVSADLVTLTCDRG